MRTVELPKGVPLTGGKVPTATPAKGRARWPWVLAAVVLVVIIAAIAGGSKKSSGPTAQASAVSQPTESSAQKDALAYIKELGPDTYRVQASVLAVQLAIVQLQKTESEANLDDVASLAQTAHDRIDEIRDEFAQGETGGPIGQADLEVFSSANSLKNAMGALVAYTGNPNPATLAHFKAQYGPARDEWDRGVRTIWGKAHKKDAPTL